MIGDKDSVLGFKALGMEVFPVTGPEEGAEILRQVADSNYAIIYVVESLAEGLMPVIQRYVQKPLPAVVFIPGNRGSLGLGMAKIKRAVEKAVGADILFGKEGR